MAAIHPDRVRLKGTYIFFYPDAGFCTYPVDSHPDKYMPELLETKVYQLGQALYEHMGAVRFRKFISTLPQVEQAVLKGSQKTKKQ